MAGVAVLATSRLSSYYALYCLLCKQTMQSEAEEQSLHRGEKKDRPKHDQEQTPKEAEGGWVRIRDVNNPRIHRNFGDTSEVQGNCSKKNSEEYPSLSPLYSSQLFGQ